MDFFEFVPGVRLAPFLFYDLPRLRTKNVNRIDERKWSYSKKEKKQEFDDSL